MSEKDETEGSPLKYGHVIAAGFGLAFGGYVAKFALGLFSSLPYLPNPDFFSIFQSIGIIIIIVGLAGEIYDVVRSQ